MIAALVAISLQQLPAYPDALHCASLAVANFDPKARNEKKGTGYDAMIFWTMALSERARTDGLAAAKFEADLRDHAAIAAAKLRNGDSETRAALKACYARVP
jgi:hypothetical protein